MAARQRGIPQIRLSSGNLIQLGYGSAQRRIWTAESDVTSAVAESVAQDKELTRGLLAAVGVPVPNGRVVDSASDAWTAAQEVDLPVVVKPRDGNHGRGVSINLGDRDAIMAAYGYAEAEGNGVVVERFIRGAQHRLLFVHDRIVAACRGESDQIVGDGVHTVAELVDELNRDPLRGEEEVCPLTPILIDDIALALLRQQGFRPDSIPAPGKTVVVLHNGDFTVDETDIVHPEVGARAVLAARTIGLDIAGIDIIARDIRRPLEEQAGAVLEVNASPGLLMHLKPLSGQPRPVGEAIVDGLFRAEQTGRIPLVAVTGTNGKSTVVGLLGAMLEAAGRRVGVASSDGLRVSGRRLGARDSADAAGARSILMNPFVDAAVLEVSASSVLDEGLGFDRCQVAVVTNLGSGDHLGRQYVDTLDTMTRVKRGPVDAVLPTGAVVLNADDRAVAAFGNRCDGEVILFGRSPDNPLLAGHCRAGGRVVWVDSGTVMLVSPAGRNHVLAVGDIPGISQGRVSYQLENVLGAVAAAWALGLPKSAIAAGLRRPLGEIGAGRFAVVERAGSEVVFSLCRNGSALEATIKALDSLFTAARRRVIYAPRADWRPADALEQGQLLGTSFDRVTLLDADGVLGAELARGAMLAGRATVRRWEGGLERAVDSELAELGRGELLLVQASGPAELNALHGQMLQTGVSLASNLA
jgi:cyanophycin synthetase